MKVGIFYNSISNPTKFPNKILLMDNFKQGVLANSDQIVEFNSHNLSIPQLDAGFILGYTLENNFRKKIIDQLSKKNVPSIFVDSNILHYARKEHEWHRYSLNSVYPDTGTYFFNNIDTLKWNNFSKWHSVELTPWRTSGNHILILAQRPNGFNMFTNQSKWISNTISTIRQYSQRPIMIRMHPGDGTRFKQIEKLQKQYGKTISISNHKSIREALENCWCCVGYASTPNVVSAIEGVPVYVEEPNKSWAKDVCFTDLSQLENPPMPDRSEWIHKIANIHWNNQEVSTGHLWRAIRSYIERSR
jgi:hypothetical protein